MYRICLLHIVWENLKGSWKLKNKAWCHSREIDISSSTPLISIKSFKDNVQRLWANWISSDLPAEIKGGNLKKHDIVLIVRWVKEVWDAIPVETVVKSFKKTGWHWRWYNFKWLWWKRFFLIWTYAPIFIMMCQWQQKTLMNFLESLILNQNLKDLDKLLLKILNKSFVFKYLSINFWN